MLDQLRGVHANVRDADNILNRWEAHDEKQEQTQVNQLASMSKEIVTIYNDELLDQVFQSTVRDANRNLKTAISDIKKAPIDQEIIEPTGPEETEDLDFDTLATQIENVESEVNEVKEKLTPVEPEPEPDPDPEPNPDPDPDPEPEPEPDLAMEEDYEATWMAVTEAFVELNDTLSQIQDDYENREEVGSWEEYAAAWEEIAEELIATKGKTKETRSEERRVGKEREKRR